MEISTIHGRKHCEKRRNCLLQVIPPFLTMFSTAIYQTAGLGGNGLNREAAMLEGVVSRNIDTEKNGWRV